MHSKQFYSQSLICYLGHLVCAAQDLLSHLVKKRFFPSHSSAANELKRDLRRKVIHDQRPSTQGVQVQNNWQQLVQVLSVQPWTKLQIREEKSRERRWQDDHMLILLHAYYYYVRTHNVASLFLFPPLFRKEKKKLGEGRGTKSDTAGRQAATNLRTLLKKKRRSYEPAESKENWGGSSRSTYDERGQKRSSCCKSWAINERRSRLTTRVKTKVRRSINLKITVIIRYLKSSNVEYLNGKMFMCCLGRFY